MNTGDLREQLQNQSIRELFPSVFSYSDSLSSAIASGQRVDGTPIQASEQPKHVLFLSNSARTLEDMMDPQLNISFADRVNQLKSLSDSTQKYLSPEYQQTAGLSLDKDDLQALGKLKEAIQWSARNLRDQNQPDPSKNT